MNNLSTILIVEDHPLMAEALQGILEGMEGIRVIGIAGNAARCMELVKNHSPDIVFLDYQLPDVSGAEVVPLIRKVNETCKIVVFTGHQLQDIYPLFRQMQISAVLSKGSKAVTITNMVRCLLDNYTMVPLDLFHQMYEGSFAAQEALTDDEVKILNLLVQGSTNEEIAQKIFVSKRSVDNYLKRIYAKLNVQSKIQAAEWFVKSVYYVQDKNKESR